MMQKSNAYPTGLVERRKRSSAKIYCSEEYFNFICFVESVYLSNLMLQMMRAHADGDIVDKIKTNLLANDIAFDKFKCLCNDESCSEFDDDNIKRIMTHMMERYANMRGTFFVRHLKCNGSGNIVQKLTKSQATRTRLANAVVCAKAVADSKVKPDVSKEKNFGKKQAIVY